MSKFYSIYSPHIDGNTVTQLEDNLISAITGRPILGEFIKNRQDAEQALYFHREHYDEDASLLIHNY